MNQRTKRAVFFGTISTRLEIEWTGDKSEHELERLIQRRWLLAADEKFIWDALSDDSFAPEAVSAEQTPLPGLSRQIDENTSLLVEMQFNGQDKQEGSSND